MQFLWVASAAAGVILLVYGIALWWWAVRDATWLVRTALLAICGLALVLRVVYTTEFPAGLNEDEPKNLACSIKAVTQGDFFGMACNSVPYLLSTVFAVPLVPLLGFGRWAMRAYSIGLSVLAPAMGYAVGSSMALEPIGSLTMAGLLAVLPWSLFYGRVSLGGELVFHELLLLAALARLIWREHAGWREGLLGGVGLALLLYGYYAGRAMLAMPFLAAVLAGRGLDRRLWCLATLGLAGLAWIPYWLHGPTHDAVIVQALLNWHEPSGAPVVHRAFAEAPLLALWARTQLALRALVEPVAQLSIWTTPTGALHPPIVLAAAALGLLLTSMRRKLFLFGGFAACLMPAIVSDQYSVSTHRMLLAFPFVPLAAGAAISALPWRPLRLGSAALLLIAATVLSVRLYFSDRYWTAEAQLAFDWERTAVVEQLPASTTGRLIVTPEIGEFAQMAPAGAEVETLTLATWWPPVTGTYVFGPSARLLAPLYHYAFPGRVQQFGGAFSVAVGDAAQAPEPFGWMLEVRCDDVTAFRGTVPVVFTPGISPVHPACRAATAVTYRWAGLWRGPETPMRLDYIGAATVTAGDEVILSQSDGEQRVPFTMPSGQAVRIEITTLPTGPRAALVELTPQGMRLPHPERVAPR